MFVKSFQLSNQFILQLIQTYIHKKISHRFHCGTTQQTNTVIPPESLDEQSLVFNRTFTVHLIQHHSLY
jgi:hypothetical protein